jgi:hypothetical protein
MKLVGIDPSRYSKFLIGLIAAATNMNKNKVR